MRTTHTTTTVAVLLALSPSLLAAQVSAASATGHASAQASAKATAQVSIPQNFSSEGRAKLEAMYTETRARGMSETALTHRVAEGQAKGASEAAILASTGKYHAQLTATQDAMISAGRQSPKPDEVERGANAMARGVTVTQIEAMTRGTPNDRSMVVAFEVLGDLAARGVPVAHAVAQIQTKLDVRASDSAIRELGASLAGSIGATANANAAGHGHGASAAGGAGGALGAAVGGGVGGAAGGTVGGAVGGVIGKPGGK